MDEQQLHQFQMPQDQTVAQPVAQPQPSGPASTHPELSDAQILGQMLTICRLIDANRKDVLALDPGVLPVSRPGGQGLGR